MRRRFWGGVFVLVCGALWVAGAALPGAMAATASGVASFETGERKTVVSFRVPLSGAGFLVQDTGTPLDGVLVTVPANAWMPSVRTAGGAEVFVYEIEVSLGYDSGTIRRDADEVSGAGYAIVLEARGVIDAQVSDVMIRHFEEPVRVTVPIRPGRLPVPYVVDEAGALTPCQIITVDPTVFVFETVDVGRLTWLWVE